MSERHDQVLNRLIEQVQALTAGPNPVSPPDDPSPPANPTAPASREPRLPPPERYDGDPGTCRSFLSQCSLIFELQPSTFPTERARIAYLVTLMSGKARAWATAIWEQQSHICHCYEDFTAEMRQVFDSPVSGREAARTLLRLRQGSRGVADYAIDFRTLAAESSWNYSSLFDAFHHGLSDRIKDELAARELPDSLESLISLAVRIDSRLRERDRERKDLRSGKQPPSYTALNQQPRSRLGYQEFPRELQRSAEPSQTEPMQLGRASLTPAERQRRIASRSCLYCGEPGHFISTCPLKGQAHQ